jgi:hypothetical protein
MGMLVTHANDLKDNWYWLTLPHTDLYHLNCISNLYRTCIYHHLHAPQAWSTPVPHVYMHRQLHRSVFGSVNHYQLPYKSFAWVTNMRIYNASQTGRTWLTKAHSQPLASFWITDTGHIQQSLCEAYMESPQRRTGHTSEARMDRYVY